MSLITDDPDESPRDCSRSRSSSWKQQQHHHHHHHGSCCSNRRRRQALIAASSTVASLLSLALILWLTLRPSSPSFSLVAATATVDDSSSAVIVVDAALTAHNPNAHATALYDRLQASSSYAGVALGAAAALPPLEQPDAGDQVLSATLTSSWRSAPAGAGGRALLLRVRIQGQLRWKVAAWVSGRHGLTVDCVAAVMLQQPPAPQHQQQVSSSPSQCATHVM
ncbi:hypothetical protein BS78_04G001200 [Paspalum vaginatum]|nr:hypothetical protein BS78_04G001200 [Paspalum vaginatum]